MDRFNKNNLRIAEVTVTDHADEISAMLSEHWQEVARNKEIMVLSPDWEKYKALENAGALLSLFAYENDQVIGYSVNIIQSHLHYSDLIYVSNDVLFVRQDMRGGTRAGRLLISESEALAKAKGAKLITWHAKENTALANLLPRIDYAVQEIVFSKGL